MERQFPFQQIFGYIKQSLGKMSIVIGPKISIETSFDEISKNPGVSFLSLDPSESKLQLFRHRNLFGGSWLSSVKQLSQN
jgi:hypothetical protein